MRKRATVICIQDGGFLAVLERGRNTIACQAAAVVIAKVFGVVSKLSLA